jgi:LysM repeat protein
MKISFLLITCALCASPALHAQDPATEERLNKLSGLIEDLIAGQKSQQKQLAELAKEIGNVRDQAAARPMTTYASQEELRHLGEAVKEIDRKRLDDYSKIRVQLEKLGTTLAAPLPPPKKGPVAAAPDAPTDKPDKPVNPEKGIEYTIQQGDTLSAIAQACKDKKIKVTVDQIVKANPGLKPEKMRPGQKLFIPALPQP